MSRNAILALVLFGFSGFLLLFTMVSEPAARVERVRLSGAPIPLMTPSPEHRQLEAALAGLGQGFAGTVGIAVTEVATGVTVGYRPEMPMPQQSVSKLWVALTALDQVDRGKLDLAEPVVVRAADLTVFHQPIREIVRQKGQFVTTYDELLARALTESDNTANDLILRRVGGPRAVEGMIDRKNLRWITFGTDEITKQSEIAGLEWRPSYAIGRRFYDARSALPEPVRKAAFERYLASPMDGASAQGISVALARIARGEVLARPTTHKLIETLNRTKSGPRRLKGGLPPGWAIAHKTGTGQEYAGEQSGYNDVGLLFAPDGRSYAVAVMIQRTRASYAERMAMMQGVTRAVAAYHEQLPPIAPALARDAPVSTSSRPRQAE